MPYDLDAADADYLDLVINFGYPSFEGGELWKLARLFEHRWLVSALRRVLMSSRTLLGSPASPTPEIKVCWIDKQPYAQIKEVSEKVELGDAAVFDLEMVGGAGRPSRCVSARALILQAKVAVLDEQLRRPTVPINHPRPRRGSSTDRELKLLAEWPEFDMYKASRSGEPVARGIVVTTQPPGGYGWYIAAPRVEPPIGSGPAWHSMWMCAPAVRNAHCVETIGSLLARFFSAGGVSGAWPVAGHIVGEPFSFDPNSMAAKSSVATGWDRVCLEILRSVDTRDLPSNVATATPAQQSATIYSNPLPQIWRTGRNLWEDFARRTHRGPKYPVLIVSRTVKD